MIQMILLALVTAIISVILKSLKPELSTAVIVCGGILLILFAVEYLSDLFSFFQELTELSGIDKEVIKLLIKMIGVGYLAEFTAQILVDFGTPTLADRLVLCSKLIILVMAIPIIKSLFSMIQNFISLL